MKRKILLSTLVFFLMLTPIFAEGNHDLIPTQMLDLQSENYILIDAHTGQTLSEKNSTERIHPASITKALTTLTALELLEERQIPLDTRVTIAPEVFENIDPIASLAGLTPNDTMTLEDILYAIMLPSGADATRMMSYYLTGDVEGLASHMNIVADRIGMTASHFINTSGLDDPNHISTVKDLSILIREALKNKEFKKIYETKNHTTLPTESHPNGIVFENYPLVESEKLGFNSLTGSKSGFTELAQLALSSHSEKDGRDYIFISTNADSNNTLSNVIDAGKVYQEVYSHYRSQTFARKGNTLKEIEIKNGKSNYEVSFNETIRIDVPNTIPSDSIKTEIIPAQEMFVAPIEVGTHMATYTISANGKTFYTQEFYADTLIERSPLKVGLEIASIVGIISGMILAVLAIIYIIYKQIDEYRTAQYYMRKENRKHHDDTE